MVFASTQLGDEQQAANLSVPEEADDGRPETAWAEGLGGPGHGEFLTARGRPSPYRVKAVQIIPGDAKDRQTFRQANRLRSILLLFSPTQRYRVAFPTDPARDRGDFRDPYWAVLPAPVASTCATLVIEQVYPGALASPGGRTSISEVKLFTELEFAGGIRRVMEDLRSTDRAHGESAVEILGGLGRRGVELVAQELGGTVSPPLLERAVRVLAASGQPESAGILVKILPRLDSRQRTVAFEAIGGLGQQAVPSLLPLLTSGPFELRQPAAALLGRLGGAQAGQALLAQVGVGPDSLRATVVSALVQLSQGQTELKAVLDAARTAAAPSAQPRRLADLILAAGRIGRKRPDAARTAARLGVFWARAPSFEVRYRVIVALGRLDPEGQLSVLREAASHDDPVLRWTALEQIRNVRSAKGTAVLAAALQDKDPRARITAALALARRPRDPGIGRRLAARLRREPWAIVATALAESIGQHCTQPGIDALFSALRSQRQGVDERALLSLARCAPKGLDRHLVAIARNNDWRTPLRIRALHLLKPGTIRARMDELLEIFRRLQTEAATNYGDERVAGALAVALGSSGDSRAAEALADALALAPHETIRTAAATGLGRLCAKTTKPTLKRAMGDASRMVKRAAAAALDKCGFGGRSNDRKTRQPH